MIFEQCIDNQTEHSDTLEFDTLSDETVDNPETRDFVLLLVKLLDY
jgi:hypothetical protein